MNSTDYHLLCAFEPRKLPNPAARFEPPPVPSVPEVSLIFNKPQDSKNDGYHIEQPMDKYDSYATWKQKTHSTNIPHQRPTTQEPCDSRRHQRRQSHSNNNPLHESTVRNDSLKHSRSDPTLARKIESLEINQRHDRGGVARVQQSGQLSPSVQRTMKKTLTPQGHSKYVFTSPKGDEEYIVGNGTRESNHEKQWQEKNNYSQPVEPNMKTQQQRFESKFSTYESAISDSNLKKSNSNNFHDSPIRYLSDYPNSKLEKSHFHSGSTNNSNFQARGTNIPNFHPNMFPRCHQLPVYCESEYPYSYPRPYSPNVQSSKKENEETVKNLLQLINNQSEQIKSLQSQIERLLKIQEESFKNREKCNCSRNAALFHENYEQNTQFSFQTTNNNHSSSKASRSSRDDTTLSQKHNGTLERNMVGSANIKELKKNVGCNYNSQISDDQRISMNCDDQMKNKIVEQKVSIGVMTSFEFTVQNNPFTSETDDPRVQCTRNTADMENRSSLASLDDISKCKNIFPRVSNMPLENIIEDSESHLSSSQQPSSDFHSTPTIDEHRFVQAANKKKITPTVELNRDHSPQLIEYENNVNIHETDRQNYFHRQQNRFAEGQQCHNDLHSSQNPRHPNIPVAQKLGNDTIDFQRYSNRKSLEARNCRSQDMKFQNLASNNGELTSKSPIFNKSMTNMPEKNDCHMLKVRTQPSELNNPHICENAKFSNNNFLQDRSSERSESEQMSPHVNDPNSQLPTAYSRANNRILSQGTTHQDNYVEESIVLSSGELEIKERPPPSPEPSIHVEMQEYSSDEESDKHTNEKEKQTPKVGWTFYNNVLGQVNQILQNSPITMNTKEKPMDKENISEKSENKATTDNVKIATLEQLRQLGISFLENKDMKDATDISNKKVTFDSSYYPRLEYRGNIAQATSTMSETDTSMQMNALALKYLSDEQLGELALQKHGAETLTHLMVSNVQGTNMSFATMRYLERYQLLPVKNNPQVDDGRKAFDKPRIEEMTNLQRPLSSSQVGRISYPSKILDISTLKQQPKLL